MHRGSGITAITGHRHSARGEERRSRRQKREPSPSEQTTQTRRPVNAAAWKDGAARAIRRLRKHTSRQAICSDTGWGVLEALTPASTPARSLRRLATTFPTTQTEQKNKGTRGQRASATTFPSHHALRTKSGAFLCPRNSERKHDGREEDSTLS